jgi:hypothetical protein
MAPVISHDCQYGTWSDVFRAYPQQIMERRRIYSVKRAPDGPSELANILMITCMAIRPKSPAPFHLGEGRGPVEDAIYQSWIGSILPLGIASRSEQTPKL